MNHVTETADRILDTAKGSSHGRHAELLVHEGRYASRSSR